MRAVWLTWTVGGVGLVLCAVIGVLGNRMIGIGSVIALALDVVFAAAVLLFAMGLSREASVVARRPLGVATLAVVALLPLVMRLFQPLLPVMDTATYESGLDAYREAEGVLTTIFYVNFLVTLGAGLIAVVQIGRAGTVPAPWRWAPLWVLIVSVAAGVLPQILYPLVGAGGAQVLTEAMLALGMLSFLARTLGLGILALVLAASLRRNRVVEVFRST